MDADSWSTRLSSASKRYQSALLSRSDMFMGFEEIDADDDIREEFPCPFCTEYFDIVGLCCHIDDEHPVEAKNGEKKKSFDPSSPEWDIVGCITWAFRHSETEKGSLWKRKKCAHGAILIGEDLCKRLIVLRKRKSRKGGSHSTLSLLRRELREGTLQSLFGGSSYLLSSSTNAAPDPLLSSFILPMPDDFGSSQLHSSAESVSVKKSTNENVTERNVQSPPLSTKDKEERSRRCEFVQGLLLSNILDDNL
ncbi:hypothetical protein LguiB_021447 [Lonicera macranthoides]